MAINIDEKFKNFPIDYHQNDFHKWKNRIHRQILMIYIQNKIMDMFNSDKIEN